MIAQELMTPVPAVDAGGVVRGIVAQADLAIQVGPHDPALVEQILEAVSCPGALVH